MDDNDPRTYAIIGAAMEVHNQPGCGFLEAVYQDALEIGLELRRIPYRRDVKIPLTYKNRSLKSFYRADFICFDSVVFELKALSAFESSHDAQVINYLKATGFEVGLLLNLGNPRLGHRRHVFTSENHRSGS
jgi:GxxExxY protein